MIASDATWLGALVLGGVVGLGVAVPLGAIGVLLLQTGMLRGWRPAAAAGLGAATVDLVYAAVAVLAGTTVTRLLVGHEQAVRLAGALVLAAVATHGVVQTVRGRRRPPAPEPDGATAPDGAPEPDGAPTRTPGPGALYARFVGLTAVNPLTVVYFTVVAAGLADRISSSAAQVAFVAGIGVASALWQLALAAAGAFLGTRVTERVRTGLALVGYGVVAALAVALAVR